MSFALTPNSGLYVLLNIVDNVVTLFVLLWLIRQERIRGARILNLLTECYQFHSGNKDV